VQQRHSSRMRRQHPVIAKVERQEAITCLEAILERPTA
jgi:pyruvate kinase